MNGLSLLTPLSCKPASCNDHAGKMTRLGHAFA
jgi:hypothetical protein